MYLVNMGIPKNVYKEVNSFYWDSYWFHFHDFRLASSLPLPSAPSLSLPCTSRTSLVCSMIVFETRASYNFFYIHIDVLLTTPVVEDDFGRLQYFKVDLFSTHQKRMTSKVKYLMSTWASNHVNPGVINVTKSVLRMTSSLWTSPKLPTNKLYDLLQ